MRIKEKRASERQSIATRIPSRWRPEVLAVQEVKDKATLDTFNADDTGGRFPHRAVIECNDSRFYQHWVHPERPNERVLRRDLPAAEVLCKERGRTLCWVPAAHLRSQEVDWRVRGEAQRRWAENQALAPRRFEAESVATVVNGRIGEGVPVLVCGN